MKNPSRTLLLLLCLSLGTHHLIAQYFIAQWVQTNGPYGGPVNSITIDGATLFAGTNAGVYRSTNNGALWTDAALTNTAVNALFLNGTSLFAGTSIGVYRSTDHGLSWTQVNTGLTDLQVNAFAVGDGILYVGTDGGVFKSSDGGDTWVRTGALPEAVISIIATTNATGGMLVYAGCSTKSQNATGLFLSTDAGTTWTKLGRPSDQSFIEFDGELSAVNDLLYAGALTKNKSQSDDNGQRICACHPKINPRDWAYFDVTLDKSIIQFPDPDPVGIVRYGWSNNSRVYVRSTSGNVYRSLGLLGWERAGEGNRPIVVESATDIFLASTNRGIKTLSYSHDAFFGTFLASSAINEGMLNSEPYALALIPGTSGNKSIIAVTRLTDIIFRSSDRGVTWSASATSPGGIVTGLASIPALGGGRIAFASSLSGMYRSTDGGSTWTETKVNPSSPGMMGVAVLGGNVLAAQPGTLYRSSDSGLSWESLGLPATKLNAMGIGPATSEGTSVFVASSSGLFRSTDIGTSWVKVGSPSPGNEPVISFATNGTALFAIVSGLGVFRSYDNGDTWNPASYGLSSLDVTSLAACGSRMFAATDGSGVFVSLDNGGTWRAVNMGLTNLRAFSLASDSSDLYVGTATGVLRYTGSFAPTASLTPTVPELVHESIPFWVEVKVGEPNAVKDLAFVSFQLSSNYPSCQYVDSTAVYGPFLVEQRGPVQVVPSSLYWKPDAQTVSISLMKTTGTSGTGVVAKAQFRTSQLVSLRDVTFSLKNVRALDPAGNPIDLAPGSAKTHVSSGGAEVWPGDCNNNGVVDASDVLPIGVYYSQTLGMLNTPGMLWQGYLREGWSDDTAKKKIYADANGDGLVNSADVLSVGLNYGKKHQPGTVGKVGSPQVADGVLQIGTPEKKQADGGYLHLPIILKSVKPVYGVAFDVKYGIEETATSHSVHFLRADTTSTVLRGGLMLSRSSDAEGIAQIGMTKIQGSGFTGEGLVMDLMLETPEGSSLWVEICNVVGNDEKGNAVSLSGSVFRSDAKSVTEDASVPRENALMQNYPNPFNPATTIRFQLSGVSAVSVKVFDILGREVITLVNEERPAGSYTVQWDATGVSSGIYCCRLTARNQAGQIFTQTKRMTIVK